MGPRVPKYIYVLNMKRVVTAIIVANLLVVLSVYLVLELNLLDDQVAVDGDITDKYDNRNSTLYRTVWFEIDGERWDAWDEVDDYEIGDHFEGKLEPWCDPLVTCDLSELVFFAFILAVILGTMGAILQRDKIEVE